MLNAVVLRSTQLLCLLKSASGVDERTERVDFAFDSQAIFFVAGQKWLVGLRNIQANCELRAFALFAFYTDIARKLANDFIHHRHSQALYRARDRRNGDDFP